MSLYLKRNDITVLTQRETPRCKSAALQHLTRMPANLVGFDILTGTRLSCEEPPANGASKEHS